tara:strand:+ start:31925 stop:32560 length:636 start_codon:yes stop_codon:yes gene_type:complete
MTKDNETRTDKDSEKKNETFTFVKHNFEAMNKAIDTEVEKRFEITELYQYQQTSRRTLMFLHITLSLSVIALTAAIIYWLFYQNNSNFIPPWEHKATQEDGLRDRNTYSALDTLSQQEQTPSSSEQNFINTSFTVFHRTLLPTGEYAVTGKTFQPDDLRKPSEQYCYLEKNQKGGNLSANPLAIIEKGKFILETTEPELINFAKRYCQFSL